MIVKKRLNARGAKPRGRAPFWLQEVAPQRSALVEEKAMLIFQPDILVESQFHSSQRSRFHLDPERVLMLAVLQDAVLCFQEHVSAKCKRKQSMHDAAEQWISNKDRSYLFSFENVCDALGFDANYMRQGLARWKRAAREESDDGRSPRQAMGRVGT